MQIVGYEFEKFEKTAENSCLRIRKISKKKVNESGLNESQDSEILDVTNRIRKLTTHPSPLTTSPRIGRGLYE